MAHATETDARQLAEESRATAWVSKSFLREIFLGRLRMGLLPNYPDGPKSESFQNYFNGFRDWLATAVDPVRHDEEGTYDDHIFADLRKLGAFGLLISESYGGKGLTKGEWCAMMQLVGGYDGSLWALLSPHQSVGVPETLKQFGTSSQKDIYLPRCAQGAISAFALTEQDVGSDPARMATSADRTADGDFILNGTKIWCTNGPIAELLIVMARHSDSGRISCFVVETDWPGVEVVQRCRFMGLSAIENGVLTFTNVRVPKENLVPPEGKGLRIALTVLNVGRLSVPAASVGAVKQCLAWARSWASERVQWGKSLGEHEAIGAKIADMASTLFAMEALVELASAMADAGSYDIRLEAAAAKEWNTARAWEFIDETVQIRGGRGYETERSLFERGEKPMGVERLLRDARVTRIFEGASEIMHLFIAREAVDTHLEVVGPLLEKRNGGSTKLRVLIKAIGFYARWYPGLWLPHRVDSTTCPALARHLRFVDRRSRRLARAIFHGMLRFGPNLQYRQLFLFRAVDIAIELYAMATAVHRANAVSSDDTTRLPQAERLADHFCNRARAKVDGLFDLLWRTEHAAVADLSARILRGEFAWLEEGLVGSGASGSHLRQEESTRQDPRSPQTLAPH